MASAWLFVVSGAGRQADSRWVGPRAVRLERKHDVRGRQHHADLEVARERHCLVQSKGLTVEARYPPPPYDMVGCG